MAAPVSAGSFSGQMASRNRCRAGRLSGSSISASCFSRLAIVTPARNPPSLCFLAASNATSTCSRVASGLPITPDGMPVAASRASLMAVPRITPTATGNAMRPRPNFMPAHNPMPPAPTSAAATPAPAPAAPLTPSRAAAAESSAAETSSAAAELLRPKPPVKPVNSFSVRKPPAARPAAVATSASPRAAPGNAWAS